MRFAVDGLPHDVLESMKSSLRYLLTRRGRLASNQVEAAAFVRTRVDLAAPDLELIGMVPRLRPPIRTIAGSLGVAHVAS